MNKIDYGGVLEELKEVCNNITGGSIVLHTDIGRVGILSVFKTKEDVLRDHYDVLVEAFEGQTLLFPTFNYDFCNEGHYDVQSSPCQVGALNEFVRATHSGDRTHTPVFNFTILQNSGYSLSSVLNPFGKRSTFAEVVERDGEIGFYGSSFEANTFLHHVEEAAGIGYRYIKRFEGIVVDDGARADTKLLYRVRPLVEGAVVYDWRRLYDDLLNVGILHRKKVGRGWFTHFAASELLAYWKDRLAQDELFLLTPDAAEVTNHLYGRYGRPLHWKELEGPP